MRSVEATVLQDYSVAPLLLLLTQFSPSSPSLSFTLCLEWSFHLPDIIQFGSLCTKSVTVSLESRYIFFKKYEV